MQDYLKYLKNKKIIINLDFQFFSFQKNNCGHTENF
jgi:hypothetical protein